MSIAGYNVDPESGDPTAGIEMNPYEKADDKIDSLGRPTATLYINEEEITLTYEEVCALASQAQSVRRQMEWAMSAWAYAEDFPSEKTHIVKHSGDTAHEKALCGREPHQWDFVETQRGWSLDPLFYKLESCPSHLCRRCFTALLKAQGRKEELQHV